MQDNFHILNITLTIALVLLASFDTKVILSAYASTFGGRKLQYKRDMTRLSLYFKVLLSALATFFLACLVISKQLDGAIAYTTILIPFAAVTCFISVVYVPLDHKTKKLHNRSNQWNIPK